MKMIRSWLVSLFLRKCTSWDEAEEADDEFWHGLTPEARLEALEAFRADRARWLGKPQGRLRRTIRLLERREGAVAHRRRIRRRLSREAPIHQGH